MIKIFAVVVLLVLSVVSWVFSIGKLIEFYLDDTLYPFEFAKRYYIIPGITSLIIGNILITIASVILGSL